MRRQTCSIMLLVALSLLPSGAASLAEADPLQVSVICPGTPSPADREYTLSATVEVSPLGDATDGCYDIGVGNLNDNEFASPWVLIDKEDGPDFTGACESCFGVTGIGGTSGTLTISAGTWSSYSQLIVGFKTGQGQLDPDWAAFALTGGITGGNWSVTGNQALSHATLWGQPGRTITAVPEPASLLLLGTGLFGAATAAARRRRSRSA